MSSGDSDVTTAGNAHKPARRRRRRRLGHDPATEEEKDKLSTRGSMATEDELACVSDFALTYTGLMEMLEAHPLLDFLQSRQLVSDLRRHQVIISSITKSFLLQRTHISTQVQSSTIPSPVPPTTNLYPPTIQEHEDVDIADNSRDSPVSAEPSHVSTYLNDRGLQWLLTGAESYVLEYFTEHLKECDINQLLANLHVVFLLRCNGLVLYPQKVTRMPVKSQVSPTIIKQLHCSSCTKPVSTVHHTGNTAKVTRLSLDHTCQVGQMKLKDKNLELKLKELSDLCQDTSGINGFTEDSIRHMLIMSGTKSLFLKYIGPAVFEKLYARRLGTTPLSGMERHQSLSHKELALLTTETVTASVGLILVSNGMLSPDLHETFSGLFESKTWDTCVAKKLRTTTQSLRVTLKNCPYYTGHRKRPDQKTSAT